MKLHIVHTNSLQDLDMVERKHMLSVKGVVEHIVVNISKKYTILTFVENTDDLIICIHNRPGFELVT